MIAPISSFTPIKYESKQNSLSQWLAEWVSSYFHLGGPVAHIFPLADNQFGVVFKEEEAIWWHKALKIMSFATLLLPGIMLLAQKALHYSHHKHRLYDVVELTFDTTYDQFPNQTKQQQQAKTVEAMWNMFTPARGSAKEEAIYKARRGTLTVQEFNQLSPKLQKTVYKVASAYGHLDCMQRLREGVQMGEREVGPGISATGKPYRTTEKTTFHFLRHLKQQGLLVTKEPDPQEYISKNNDIGRIQGRNFIQAIAQKLNLKHIKLPKKIAVIDSTSNFRGFIQVNWQGGHLASFNLDIHAETITPIQRKATKEEMIELLDLIEATGFNDTANDNIMMGRNHEGEEGLYFIDTEYDNFSSVRYEFLFEHLKRLIDKEDFDWLQGEITRRSEKNTKKKDQEIQRTEVTQPERSNFIFSVRELLA